ncbi:DeoR/GlpR family DNA-binding transcription regulator [Canibacter zhoujuaniae]|uniref:DeoR/GlpR family DNA-binding transcription regulator n=1 Tax=Canibacter zhoujuaniae TaxID=2708343 RepID=UPI0014233AA6|nr:DeoR/GlpR family DNA-binding transcription regulator [Canibacter zhoujuaniae]
MTSREDRLNGILKLLSQHGNVTVEEIVAALGVSPATVRRDLDSLQERRLLARTHGGATKLGAVDYRLSSRTPEGGQAANIEAVAAAAVKLVQPGTSIGLSGGRTTSAMARLLGADERFTDAGLTVVTNAINIAQALVIRPYIRVVVSGGMVRQGSYELSGPFSELILRQITLDQAFIGVNGLDPLLGATVSAAPEAPINRLMAERASESWVVCDSSKLGQRSFAVIGELKQFTGVVTDGNGDAKILQDLGVEDFIVQVA